MITKRLAADEDGLVLLKYTVAVIFAISAVRGWISSVPHNAPPNPTPASPPRQPFLPNPHNLIGVPAYSSKVSLIICLRRASRIPP
jgi:hypothetical protein